MMPAPLRGSQMQAAPASRIAEVVMPATRSTADVPAKRTVVFKWSRAPAQLTTDLLDLVASNPSWRQRFFATDGGKGTRWKEARAVLLELFSGDRERGYMQTLVDMGLIREVLLQEEGMAVRRWEPTESWCMARSASNPVKYRLKDLLNKYNALQEQEEYRVDGAVHSATQCPEDKRLKLAAKLPWFWQIHALVHNHIYPTHHRSQSLRTLSLPLSGPPERRSEDIEETAGWQMRIPSPPVVPIKQEFMEISDTGEREGYGGRLSGRDIMGSGQVDRQHAGNDIPPTGQKRSARDKSGLKPVGRGAGELSEASENSNVSDNSEASDNGEAFTSSRESDDHEEKVSKGEAEKSIHAESASGRENVITGSTTDSSDSRHREQPSVAVTRTPCPAPHTTAALRNSTNAQWCTPARPKVEVKVEALDDAPTSRIATEPPLALVGSPSREPVVIQHDELPCPAYLLAAPLSARSVLTHRIRLYSSDRQKTPYSIPNTITLNEVLNHARRDCAFGPMDLTFILLDESRKQAGGTAHRLHRKSQYSRIGKRQHNQQCVLYAQLAYMRGHVINVIAQYPLDFVEPIHVCGTAEADDLDYMRATYRFLQLCGIPVQWSPNSDPLAARNITTDLDEESLASDVDLFAERWQIGARTFWQAFDRLICGLIPTFERDVLLQGAIDPKCFSGLAAATRRAKRRSKKKSKKRHRQAGASEGGGTPQGTATTDRKQLSRVGLGGNRASDRGRTQAGRLRTGRKEIKAKARETGATGMSAPKVEQSVPQMPPQANRAGGHPEIKLEIKQEPVDNPRDAGHRGNGSQSKRMRVEAAAIHIRQGSHAHQGQAKRRRTGD